MHELKMLKPKTHNCVPTSAVRLLVTEKLPSWLAQLEDEEAAMPARPP